MNDQHDDGAPTAGRANMVPTGIDDDAMDWVIRMTSPDADWDAFTTWLEADAARADRYDQAASALRDAEVAVAAVPVRRGDYVAGPGSIEGTGAATRIRRWPVRWIGGAAAAALIGAIGMGVWTEVPRPYDVATAAGEQRTIALADGSSIMLAGASRVRLDRSDPRMATVERGEMLFRVRHDDKRPFAVRVGDLRLVDLGTVFDVKMAAGRTRVAVAEGAVMVDPDGAAVRLGPGQAVISEGSSLKLELVDRADVGSWRHGRLAFDDSSLAEVAADLSAQMGRRISAAPAVAGRTFRGTLDIRALKNRPGLLGTLLGVDVRQKGSDWVLEPRP